MKKIVLVPVAVFAMMFALPSACDATGCAVRARVVQAVVIKKVVAVVDAVDLIQRDYQHSYSYDGGLKARVDLVEKENELRAKDIEILNLKFKLYGQGQGPLPPVVFPPGGLPAAQPGQFGKPMPQADAKGEHPGLTVKRQACASCHESAVSKAKGGGFVMFQNGQLVQLTDEQIGDCLKRISDGDMPKGGPPLSSDQKAKIMDFVFGSK